MLTKDQADKIIARHGERGITSAFFLLVDTLTEGEAEATVAPRGRFSREQVMSMSASYLTLACSEYVLRETPPRSYLPDWAFAMWCRNVAVQQVGAERFYSALCFVDDDLKSVQDVCANSGQEDFIRAALLAVTGYPE